MIAGIVDALRCPHCAAPLTLQSGTTSCRNRHSFDVARQGYLNLMAAASGGDTASMVAARADFLATGNYSPIRDALVSAASGLDGLIVEIGAGTAYYLTGLLAEARRGIAIDVSRYAARRAAKTHPRIGSVMADIWHGLPLRDGVASVVLDVFAPRNAAEIARILAPDGRLLVVTPNQSHLHELVDALGLVRVDESKERRLAARLGAELVRTSSTCLEYPMLLDHIAIGRLVAMGPSAWHTNPDALEQRLAGLPDPAVATASVTLSTWQH